MIQTYGVKVKGEAQYIPRSMLTESVIGSIYELRIKTTGVPNPQEAANLLLKELPRKFPGLHIIWIGIKDDQINIQLSGSPFAWAVLLLFLPTLLTLIGIVTTLTAVYLVFTTIPGWVIGLFLIGVALIIFGPKIAEWTMAEIPTI